MPNGTRELQSGASSAMSYIMDPSARDWSKGSLRGSSGPFSPDTDGDVDGDPVQPSVDLELARKKKELEVIEEKIARKKAVLATRQLKHGAKDMPKKQTASTTVKGIAKQTKINNTIFKTYNQVTDKSSRVCLPLKRRVLDILRKFRRTPVRHLLRKTKKQNKMRALELMISAPLENEEAHPLRLRVKVLMNQRRSPNNEVVPDDKQHNPTIQRPVHSLRTQEKDIAATGFQRFLNVLNEGVDLNKLSKIVNEENELLIVGEELPQVWPTLLEGHVDYSSRSKSSPFEEKKVRLEDEQRYEQMQTLLEIVGLDLGVEELGRLTDRTNDRLYGKMGDLKRDRAREGESPARERCRQRCSSTREKDRVRERDRSERNRKGDGHRHSSSRERDKDTPVVRETNRSERNRDKDWDRDPEKDWDGGRERDRDRSRRDWGRYRSERDGDRDPEKSRDGGREKDRDRYRSERDRKREIAKDVDRWLQRTRNGDKRSRTRDWDRERSERDRYGDESRESSIELYSYSMDPVFPVSHPHASMMATYSTTQYSQYMAYHSSPYTMAFPPGWGYPAGTMPAGIMPPGIMPPGTMLPGIMPAGAMLPSNKPRQPNPPGYPPYTNFPPYYSNGTTALNQTYTYTQPASTRAVLSQRCTYIQPTRNRRKKTQKHARGKVSCQMVTKKSPTVLTTQIATKKSPPEQGSKIKAKGRNNIFFTGIFMKSYHSHLRKFQYYLKRLAKRRNKVHQRKRKRLLAEAAGKVAPQFPFEPEPKKDGEKLHADTSEEVVPQEAANNLETPSETGPKKEPEGEKLHADTAEEVVPQEAAKNVETPSETGPKKEPEGEKLHADAAEKVAPQVTAMDTAAPSEMGPKKKKLYPGIFMKILMRRLKRHQCKIKGKKKHFAKRREKAFQYKGKRPLVDTKEKVPLLEAAKDSGNPSEPPLWPKKKKKKKTLEEKGGIYYPGIFIRVHRTYLTRGKLAKAKAAAEGTEAISEPAPTIEGGGGMTEGEELLADTLEKGVPQVATNDSGLPPEPGPNKEPEREEETMLEEEKLLADHVAKVSVKGPQVLLEPKAEKDREGEDDAIIDGEKLLADPLEKVAITGPGLLSEPEAEKETRGDKGRNNQWHEN
nr:zinc finger CCCH domain-containing protein 18-like isoform X5 [Oncorhynchus nerka]